LGFTGISGFLPIHRVTVLQTGLPAENHGIFWKISIGENVSAVSFPVTIIRLPATRDLQNGTFVGDAAASAPVPLS